MLLVTTGIPLLSRRLKVPYVAGLVLAGLAITELLPRRIFFVVSEAMPQALPFTTLRSE
ncbi:hypothetical protein [Nostoc sp. UHCC 0870]|uniref:hypothetical protein n=1 Tax=Nostoc sp. UHCC 0870 TaxID=2914041 RepID=UPI001EE08C6C|nr:hypothetical protein [Nostoc sp. UHCC 0870]UKO99145.1 hypothetical protein L6494_05330 [Nostoc sp. UHCC 0870]